MEQGFQRLNQPDLPNIDNPLTTLIELLRSFPTVTPRKRVSISSSDSVVNSLHMLSPAMLTTPENPHSFQLPLFPPTSRFDTIPLPSPHLTPIQQFLHKSRNRSDRDPKYNRTQPDHPDSPSVLYTRTRQGHKI